MFGIGKLLIELKQLNRQVGLLLVGKEKIMAALDDLTAQVAATHGTIESAIVLIQGLSARLDEAIAAGNPAALEALSADLKAETDALSAAVAAVPPATP